MVIANLNVGNSLHLRHLSLGVYGIVLAGYAANSKYPFLGGIRSSAQMISYEIAMGMSVVPLFLIAGGLDESVLSSPWREFLEGTGGLNLNRLVSYQANHGWLTSMRPSLSRSSWPPCSPRPAGSPSTCRRRSRNWPAATTWSTVRLGSPCFSWPNTRR